MTAAKERPGRLRRMEIVLAWLAAALVSCAFLVGWIGPRLGAPDAGLEGLPGFASETVVALWNPLGALATVLALLLLIRRHRLAASAPALVALLVLGPELWTRTLRSPHRLEGAADGLRLATVNLAEQNRDDPLMERSLRQLDADVLVLHEVTAYWQERLKAWFPDDYPHRWLAEPVDNGDPPWMTDGFRMAIWSRLAPAGILDVEYTGGIVPQVRVPLVWRDRIFALYGIHPRKPYPYGLYAGTFRGRRQILAWIRREVLPTVVAGDFNAPPQSAFVRRMRELGLIHASESVHGRALPTWPMDGRTWLPFRIAIDHVMHSADFTATDFRLGMTTNSDHAPVLVELIWSRE